MSPWTPGDPLPGEERPFYLAVGGELVAVVRHAALGHARAAVVLAGPMSLERSHAALTWVRWARTLARSGYEVFRFDYRAVGESSGDFREQSLDTWLEDLSAVVAHAKGAGLPVWLVGLRLGALLGKRLFDEGACDGLIAWDPPTGGRPMLMDMLRRKLAADYMELAGERKTRDAYVRELETGEIVEVEGYHWSPSLWRSAPGHVFGEVRRRSGRWLVIHLDGRPAERLPDAAHFASVRIPKPPFWLQSGTLVPDVADLFAVTQAHLDAWTGELGARPTTQGSVDGAAQGTLRRGVARKLEVLDLDGGRCVGTWHLPPGRSSSVGLLWLNFGYVPRDGHGGLATQASDVLAARGVPCFRYDLPGLGDAPGPLPPNTQAFYPQVTSGRYTHVTRQLVKHLCQAHGLDGLVLAGLCGGAVNAIYVGDEERRRVKGLVLLEPELYVTEPTQEATPTSHGARPWLRAHLPQPVAPLVDHLPALPVPVENRLAAVRAKVFSYWGWMRLLTHENRYARFVPLPRKAILDFVLSRSELPAVTNLPLTAAWRRWVDGGGPTLVITAAGKLREVFLDRINATVLRGVELGRYQHPRLERTNHIFTSGGAIATVTSLIVRAWPMLTGEAAAPPASSARAPSLLAAQ